MSEKRSYYYPFDYNIHKVYTVAFYGSQSPIVCKGSLILRTYYTDDTKRTVDIHHTSEHFIDTGVLHHFETSYVNITHNSAFFYCFFRQIICFDISLSFVM